MRVRLDDERLEADRGIALVFIGHLLDQLLHNKVAPLQLDIDLFGNTGDDVDNDRLERKANPLEENEHPEAEGEAVGPQGVHREHRQSCIRQHRDDREHEEDGLPHANVLRSLRKGSLVQVQQSPGISLDLCDARHAGEEASDRQGGDEECGVSELHADLAVVL